MFETCANSTDTCCNAHDNEHTMQQPKQTVYVGYFHTCEQCVVAMSDKEAHQVAVAHCVNSLHNDLIESKAGWKLLGWDCCSPVHPLTALLIKEIVVHGTILQERRALDTAMCRAAGRGVQRQSLQPCLQLQDQVHFHCGGSVCRHVIEFPRSYTEYSAVA